MELVPEAQLQTQEILGTPEGRWANNRTILFYWQDAHTVAHLTGVL